MHKVMGIGGFFFAASNPKSLADWYHVHLGIDPCPPDYDTPPWRQQAGETVFAPFSSIKDEFEGKERPFMLNFRVADLEAMNQQLERAGIEVKRDPKDYPNGRFAWLNDPEGNPIELWQPRE